MDSQGGLHTNRVRNIMAKNAEPIEEVVVVQDEDIQDILKTFMDHQKKAIEETRLALKGLLPAAFKEHGKVAVEEMIEGYRTLFNTVVDDVNDRVKKIRIPAEKDEDPVA